MKTIRHSALVLAALLVTPCALHAADTGIPEIPAPPPGTSAAALPPDLIVSQDLNRADAVNVRLATGSVTDAVESAEFATRDPSIALAQRGAAEGRAITASLKAGARILGDNVREEVDTALIQAERARDRLNTALSKARESTEDRWKDVRAELAERYEQYAEALEDTRRLAVEGGVKFEPLSLPAPDSAGLPGT